MDNCRMIVQGRIGCNWGAGIGSRRAPALPTPHTAAVVIWKRQREMGTDQTLYALRIVPAVAHTEVCDPPVGLNFWCMIFYHVPLFFLLYCNQENGAPTLIHGKLLISTTNEMEGRTRRR